MKVYSLIAVVLSIFSFQESDSLENILIKCIRSYDNIQDYQCLFYKKELVRGKIKEDKNIILKFMKSDHVYMKWTEGKAEGIEVLYVKGKYKNKMVVNLNGLFGFLTISIDPEGSNAMKNSRHPITEAGMGHILKLFEENYDKAKINNELNISYHDNIDTNGKQTIYINAVFPKDKGYYGHKIDIQIDKTIYLPVSIIVYGWDNEFLEEYLFEDIKTNMGLKEIDFDKENPEYDF